MIITKEVQEILDEFEATGGQELVDSAIKVLETYDHTLGSDTDRWYGALMVQSYWMMWFKAVVTAWPGGIGAAYDFLPSLDIHRLLDVFLNSHPMGKVAMEKYGKFNRGREGDLDDRPMNDVDEKEIVELYRQRMARKGAPGRDAPVVELKDEEADALLDLLGLKIKDGQIIEKEKA